MGLVLSGGGASGFAHIGVLKALEEKGVPIDYITGTSAGALVGGLYSAGYSPEEMEALVAHPDFSLISTGGLRADQKFLTKEDDVSASLIELSFSTDSLLQKSLPTNFTSSTFLDFVLFRLLSAPSIQAEDNFDQLFVPFRCVASDIVKKENVVFSHGHLNEAIRASMTFPFYFEPLQVDGRLLFDGGLYDNFPSQLLYDEFQPDFVIGSNVSYNAAAPTADDLLSQVINMLVRYSDFTLPCEDGILIEPQTDLTTFDFEDAKEAIDAGYRAGLLKADSILARINTYRPKEELLQMRQEYRRSIKEVEVHSISVDGNGKMAPFVKQSMKIPKKRPGLTIDELEKQYFRLAATSHIDFLFPTLDVNDSLGKELNLVVRPAKDLIVKVGGHFSSRPVNIGYVGLTYMRLRKRAIKINAESYFGKFYSSFESSIKIEFPGVLPVTVEPYGTLNQWDYFRSFATFFEDVLPSFLVQNEQYYGLKIFHPLANNLKSTYDIRSISNEDDYYQTENFSSKDTSDITFFNGMVASWRLEQNSLNRKQWASSGHYFGIQFRYIQGIERSISGSTSPIDYDRSKFHEWINLNLDIQSFIIDKPGFHLGLSGQGTFNSQSLFANYTATILNLGSFDPLPDMRTYFLPEYRSPLFFGGGVNTILSFPGSIEWRLDTYFFQPLVQLIEQEDGQFGYAPPFGGESFFASSSVIYHSFAGPVRLTVNYFPRQINPVALQFSFGYVLFNDRALR